MKFDRRAWLSIAAVAFLILVGSGAYLALRPEFCDGIPRQMGGCDSDRPEFDGATCGEVAKEVAGELNARIPPLFTGPDGVRGEGRSVRLYNVETLVFLRANIHMRDSGLAPDCDVDAFLSTVEAGLSGEVKDGVGNIMYEAMPVVEYEEWRERLTELVELIFTDPHLPADASA